MTKYLIILNPIVDEIYQVDIDLYDSEEDARLNSLINEEDIYKIIPIEF